MSDPTAAAAEPAALSDLLAALLAPIAGDDPCGESLRYDPLMDKLQELRRQDDPSLPQGVWTHELKRSDFAAVAALCSEALTTRSKDLQVAAWLTEAWTRQEGFAGCARGLRLLDALCERYWQGLHPRIEDDDLDFRLAPLHWLVHGLPTTLTALEITHPTLEDEQRYRWNDYLAAQRLANLARTDAKAAQQEATDGKPTLEKIRLSLTLTPSDFLRELKTDLARCRAGIDQLDQRLTALAGEQAPGFAALREPLAAIAAFVTKELSQRSASEPPEEEPMNSPPSTATGPAGTDAAEPATAGAAAAGRPASAGGAITSRAEAYRRLEEAAEYLRRTEPHSPVPYLVQRAISWGGLSLAELLSELLQGGNDLKTVRTLLGLEPKT
jgi:type VI secretion system ImpA family protein